MLSWIRVTLVLLLASVSLAEKKVDFNRDVRPLLSGHCFQCHGPDEQERQGELRLDQFDGAQGAQGAIVPGALDQSELWTRINATDDRQMPPADSDVPPLTSDQKDVLKRWIEQGGRYAQFWSFVPPQSAAPEPVSDARWNQSRIDQLVYQRLREQGMQPSVEADRRTLIRRLSLDLTGLPPTRTEIRSFLDDDSDQAYERVVDRLLNSPHYGEHMARYWLDLVRFADTNGIHHDHLRDFSPYRAWVIRAFNDNLPYSEFAQYQLAGDLYEDASRDQQIASGFNRLHLIIDRGTALPEESYTRNVIDRVTAVGTAFLGLTVQCAVCHDHKYDPITARDFYRLFAFFNNFDGEPETGGRQGSDFRRGLQPPYIRLDTAEQAQELQQLDTRLSALDQQLKALREDVRKAAGDDKSLKQDQLRKVESERAEISTKRTALDDSIPAAMVMRERAERRRAWILKRGQYDQPGEEVLPGTPGFLPSLPREEDSVQTRMDFSKWVVDRGNPLTARVAVNRFWQQLFGVGIVRTSEDFGSQGEWPSHPELLDELAVSFMESGWNVRQLMKSLVMSQTYRQSSAVSAEQYAADPENRMLSRGARYRLDAEVIRDQILASSGLLNRELYGRSVRPPQPAGLWETVIMPSSYPKTYAADEGRAILRRSLYTFWKRGMPPPQMTILNAPTRESCIARRERTNTPLQALLLLNEPEYLRAARHLSAGLLKEGSDSDDARLSILYETITAREPNERTLTVLRDSLSDLRKIYSADRELTEQLCAGVDLPDQTARVELAAWTMTASAIYNLDLTRNRE